MLCAIDGSASSIDGTALSIDLLLVQASVYCALSAVDGFWVGLG